MAIGLAQGQFHWVKDEVIVFPEDRDREPHESRGCIIVEGNESLALGGKRVQVVPTSSQTHRKDKYDVVIPSPPLPGGVECVALVQHLQPILREDLKSLVGPLNREWVDKVLAAHILALGIVVEGEKEEDVEEEGSAEQEAEEDIPF
jgi:mRNA-degrading endonuclease toxin of MazEF toxin-antitoxin module